MPALSLPQSSPLVRTLLSLFYALVFAVILPLVVSNFSSDKKSLKDVFMGKWWPNWLFIILVFALSFCILLSINLSGVKTPVLSATTEDQPLPQPVDKNAVWNRLADKQSDWDLTMMNNVSEGVYCPRIYNNNFIYRSIWLRQLIPVVFPKIQLRFSVKQLEGNKNSSRAIIQLGSVFSKDYSVGNFYLPFDKSQGVNFESYDSMKNGFVFQNNPGSLPLTIKPNSVVTITVSTTNVLNNIITYKIHVEFIPDNWVNTIPVDFEYFVTLPDSSPRQLMMKFGLGVFSGSCLQDVEYAIGS